MYIVMPASKDDRINIRVSPELKRDATVIAEMRFWNLTQLITDLLRIEVEAIKTANLEGFKDASLRVQSAETSARPQRIKTRKVAIHHVKSNEHEQPIPNAKRLRATGSGRKR